MQNINMTERSGAVTPKSDDAQARTSGLSIEWQAKTREPDYQSSGDGEQACDAQPDGINQHDEGAASITLFLTLVIESALQVLSQLGQPPRPHGRHTTDGLGLSCRTLSNGLIGVAARLTARLGDHHG